MGRPYGLELKELTQTYEWALGCSIQELTEAIHDLRGDPFLSIGSGGSLTVAAFWAMVHEEWTGMPARHKTPLDLLALSSTGNYSVGLVSARVSRAERNQDKRRRKSGPPWCECSGRMSADMGFGEAVRRALGTGLVGGKGGGSTGL